MSTNLRILLVFSLALVCAGCDREPPEPKKPTITLKEVVEEHRSDATARLKELVSVAEKVQDKEQVQEDTLEDLEEPPRLCWNNKYNTLSDEEQEGWKDCNAEVLYDATLLTYDPDKKPHVPPLRSDPQRHVYLGDDSIDKVHQLLTRGETTNRYDTGNAHESYWSDSLHSGLAAVYFERFMRLRYFFIVRPRESSEHGTFLADVFLYDAEADKFRGAFPVERAGTVTYYESFETKTGKSSGIASSTNTVVKKAHKVIASTIEEKYPSANGERGMLWVRTIGRLQF